MTKLFINQRYIFNQEDFPNIFNSLSKDIVLHIYKDLLKKHPDIRYIKIKMYFFNEKKDKYTKMFFFKERPNKISYKDFQYNWVSLLAIWLKEQKDISKFEYYQLKISYVI